MKKILFLCLVLSGCTTLSDHQFVGQSAQSITRQFGTPLVKRTESPYQLWTYGQDDCAKLFYFDTSKTVQYVETICP